MRLWRGGIDGRHARTLPNESLFSDVKFSPAKFREFFCADWRRRRYLLRAMTDSPNKLFHDGARHIVTIHDIAFGGEGVARLDDFVIFVPFVALGENVEVELTEVKKRFARAKLLRVISASPDRVDPPCQYFGDCGGCQYQHIAYNAELAIKHKQIGDLFQRLAGLDPALVQSVVPCPQPYGYRNRIMIRSQWDKTKQGLNIGFIRADNRLVVDIQECKISEPELTRQIQYVRQHPPPKGGIKVVLRIAPEGWVVPRDSFFQNNFFLLPKLVEGVRDCVRGSGVKFLIDVYCGVGFFALETADLVERPQPPNRKRRIRRWPRGRSPASAARKISRGPNRGGSRSTPNRVPARKHRFASTNSTQANRLRFLSPGHSRARFEIAQRRHALPRRSRHSLRYVSPNATRRMRREFTLRGEGLNR
jgi:predicted RNA-binding protein with TRAM domain